MTDILPTTRPDPGDPSPRPRGPFDTAALAKALTVTTLLLAIAAIWLLGSIVWRPLVWLPSLLLLVAVIVATFYDWFRR